MGIDFLWHIVAMSMMMGLIGGPSNLFRLLADKPRRSRWIKLFRGAG